MDYEFDWNYASSGTPYVTISKLGISMNAAVIKQLGEPEKIMIGFDEKACVIGIRPYHNEENVATYDFKNKITIPISDEWRKVIADYEERPDFLDNEK